MQKVIKFLDGKKTHINGFLSFVKQTIGGIVVLSILGCILLAIIWLGRNYPVVFIILMLGFFAALLGNMIFGKSEPNGWD